MDSIPGFQTHGIGAADFNLDSMTAFCREAGDFQDGLAYIHVAGTNGKGTTCHMLASVLQDAGHRTGLYTSPHLFRFQERIRLNGSEIDDDSLILFFNTYFDAIQKHRLTYFEITTALAFWYFSRKKADIVVLECGLGGRLDATNIIVHEVAVISSIGFDHTDVLGNTLSAIAGEKAGIIKPGKPVVTGILPGEAHRVIKKKAADLGCPMRLASDLEPTWQDGRIHLNIPKKTSISVGFDYPNPVNAINAAIAWQVLDLIRDRFKTDHHHFEQGLENIKANTGFRARFERLIPGMDWFYDGAHNSEALHQILNALAPYSKKKPVVLVFNVMKDKLTDEFAGILSKFNDLYYFETDNKRAATEKEVRRLIPRLNLFEAKGFFDSNKTALVIFSGSFYFYQYLMSLIQTYGQNLNASSP